MTPPLSARLGPCSRVGQPTSHTNSSPGPHLPTDEASQGASATHAHSVLPHGKGPELSPEPLVPGLPAKPSGWAVTSS